jgi:AcrR family transcriptional regulator
MSAAEPADTARVRGPYRNGIRRREQIVASASDVFARHGYANASLREIARRVGVTPAALLRHFDSKEELLLAVLDKWDDDNASTRTIFEERPPMEHFAALVRTMESHHDHPGLIELFLTLCAEAWDPSHPAHDWVTGRYRRVVETGLRSLRWAIERGDIAPMSEAAIENESRTLFAVMDGLELQWLTDPSVDLGGLFAAYLRTALVRWGAIAPLPPVPEA